MVPQIPSATSTSPAELEAELVAAARAHADAVIEQQEKRYRSDARFYFDASLSERAVDFFPRFLRHSKGRHRGKPFVLEPWQARIVRIVFGYRWRAGYGEAEGSRVVRQLWLEVARKNGKSTFLAGLALLLLIADGEGSPEIYGAAADTEQASIIFREASTMVSQSPELSKHVEAMKTAMVCPKLDGTYRVLSGVPQGKHGLNPSGLIVDEVHELQGRDLVDTLHTATGARTQPLEAYATTAGYDRKTICWELHEIAVRVGRGELDDPSFLPIIFAAEESDDWSEPQTLAKANPSLGVAVRLSYLLGELKRARETPGYTNTFRRLHLNQWTETATKWLDMTVHWPACRGPLDWREMDAALAGRRCWGGMDLAKVRDFSAWLLVFPPEGEDRLWHVLPRFWLPDADFAKRMRETRVRLDLWRDAGALSVTQGDTTDFGFIGARILRDHETFRVEKVGVDPIFGGELIQHLQENNVEVVAVRQGFLSLAAPTAEIERQVVSHAVCHGGHPVLTWMAGNVVPAVDPAGNMKPDKSRSGDKIDGIAAWCNALALAMGEAVERSIYDDPSAWQGEEERRDDGVTADPAVLVDPRHPDFAEHRARFNRALALQDEGW